MDGHHFACLHRIADEILHATGLLQLCNHVLVALVNGVDLLPLLSGLSEYTHGADALVTRRQGALWVVFCVTLGKIKRFSLL